MNNKKIKVSDHIIKFLEKNGVKHVFLMSGGGNIHIIDSLGNSKKIKYVSNPHEQAASIAAEAYSRLSGAIGVCIVTTGPGGTNAITGVYGAWTDSIPMLIISGQIRRETIGAGKIVRQLGDQEINIVDVVKPITKYAITILDPLEIDYQLEKAFHIAKADRPGPVWLDIPLDVQGAYVDKDKLKKFDKKEIAVLYKKDKSKISKDIAKIFPKLKKAHRPILIVGNGIRLAGASKELLELIKNLKIPVITSFAGYDLVASDNKYYHGRMGIFGQRGANFIVQNSDFILSIGSRLPIRTVGYNLKSFARKAYKVIVDIDKSELNKQVVKADIACNYDAKNFIQQLLEVLKKEKLNLKISEWLSYCERVNKKYPVVLDEYKKEKKYINPYFFIDTLSKYLKKDEVIAVSNGSALVCTYQALKIKQGQRVILNSGCAAMGYGLPASVGACFANNKKQIICLEGDGSIQLNIQELQTIFYHKLPIKIFVYNNDGFISIRLTQNALFNGKYVAVNTVTGVSCPDFIKVAKAYGIKTEKITNNKNLDKKIKKVLKYNEPVLCEILVSPEHKFIPKAASQKLSDGSFVSQPLENMFPFLSKKELKENMLIPLLDEE